MGQISGPVNTLWARYQLQGISVSISERLKEVRAAKRLNQTAFGALGGVSKTTQKNYESGLHKPSFEYLEALAAAGVDVYYLLTGRRDPDRLTGDQQTVLRIYNSLNEDSQYRAIGLLEALAATEVDKGQHKRIRRREESDL